MAQYIININIDPPAEIAKLHGVGIVLANRICRHRESKGFFRSPDDLAKVDGINLDFAIMLGAQIDWQLPVKADSKKERDLESAFILGAYTIALSWVLINRSVPRVFYSLEYYQAGFYSEWTWIWIHASLSLFFLFETFRGVSMTVLELTTSKVIASKLEKIIFALFGMAILSVISSGLGHATYYQLYAEQGWKTLWNNSNYMLGLLGAINLVAIMLPRMLVFYKSNLAKSNTLRKIYDFGITTSAPLMAWYIWSFRLENPLWIIAIAGLFGFIYLSAGYQTLRYGTSFFSSSVHFFSTEILQQDETSFWIKWLNIRLPDPEQQQALKHALEKTYPTSKTRTIIGAIVFGAGGWLLITALTSLVDWFIQNWLDKFIK